MSNIRTTIPIPTRPWEDAKAQFLQGLSSEETKQFKDATPENLFYDASNAQRKHAHDSRAWLLQERMSPLVEAVEEYGKALDVFANTYGLILSPIWGSIRIILHIASEAGKFQEHVVDMLAQIGDVLPRFRIYQSLFHNHERLLYSLSNAYLEILSFCTNMKDFLLRARRSLLPLSIVLRSAWKPVDQEFNKCLLTFRKYSKQVDKEARLAHLIESARSREIELANQALMLRNEKLRRRHRTLAALPTVNYIGRHDILSNARHEGTTEWVLTKPQYTSWNNVGISACLCCYGIPGSGKSVIAASLVDHLLATLPPRSVVCYYYCDYADHASLEPIHIVASLIKQIMERLPLDYFDDQFECPFQEGKPLPRLLVARQYLLQLLQEFDTTYLILDGMDELDKYGQTDMLALVDQMLKDKQFIAKVFLDSRPEELRVKKAMRLHSTLHLSTSNVEQSIVLYIKDQIKQLEDPHPLSDNERLRQEVIQSLVGRAQGMFLWVKFQLYDIKEDLTEMAIRTTLQELPSNLEQTYQRIIDRIHHGPNGKGKIENMNRVFCWVAGARRSLQVEEIEEAVGLEPTDTHLQMDRIARNTGQRLVSDCGNLIVYNEEDRTVTFAHHTVEQYFHKAITDRVQPLASCGDFHNLNDRIGEICLAYLSFSDFDNQLAKITEPLQLNQESAEQIVWGSVPFAKNIRQIASWARPWRRPGQDPPLKAMNLALPVPSGPRSSLRQEFALLGYVIDHWPAHTAELRPTSTSWAKFRHVALYRHLDFEHRPWNDKTYQSRFESAIKELQLTSLQSYSSAPIDRQNEGVVRIYSWAFRYAIGSLLALVEADAMTSYLECVKAQHIPEGPESGWIAPSEVAFLLAQFPKQISLTQYPVSCAKTSRQAWNGGMLHGIISSFLLWFTSDRIEPLLEFLAIEYYRWGETDVDWQDILLDAAKTENHLKLMMDLEIYAAGYGHLVEKVLLDLSRCQLPARYSRDIEWEILFLLDHCICQSRISAHRLQEALVVRDPIIRRALGLILLSRGFPVDIICSVLGHIEAAEENAICQSPAGDWTLARLKSRTTYECILPLLDVKVFTLAQKLAKIDERLWTATRRCSGLSSSLSAVGGVSKDLCDIWEAYGRSFDIRVIESAGYPLLLRATVHKDPDLIARLAPLYKAFIADADNHFRVLRILTKAMLADFATIEAILKVQWPSTVADIVQRLRNHLDLIRN